MPFEGCSQQTAQSARRSSIILNYANLYSQSSRESDAASVFGNIGSDLLPNLMRARAKL